MSPRTTLPSVRRSLRQSLLALFGVALLNVFLLVNPAYAADPISFDPPRLLNVSDSPQGIGVADFDGDNKLDIAASTGDTITVCYGNGDGTFVLKTYPVGSGYVVRVLATDVDQDGRLDIVFPNANSSTVNVIRNLGGRAFSATMRYACGGFTPYGMAAGDFNGDSRDDIAVANDNSNNVAVLLNDGNGGFRQPVTYGTGSFPANVATGDLNRDGFLDLVVSNYVSGDLNVYLGDGAGGFQYRGAFGVGDYLPSALLADYNGDGILDAATTSYFNGRVAVLLGVGDGSFGAPMLYPANSLPHFAVTADLDSDGRPDIAAPNAGETTMTVLRNNGGGAFAGGVAFATNGRDVRFAASGDFNGDGKPDVAVTNSGTNTIAVFLNTTIAPSLSGLTLDFASVIGGCETPMGEVRLSRAAPPGGALVELTSANPAANVPATILVPAGAESVVFPIATSYVAAPVSGAITATYEGAVRTANLTVRPIGVALLETVPNPVRSGKDVIAQVTLDCPAGPGKVTVTLTSSNTRLAVVPDNVVITDGEISALFRIRTRKTRSVATVRITATANGVSVTRILTIRP